MLEMQPFKLYLLKIEIANVVVVQIHLCVPNIAFWSSPHEPRERGDLESFRRALDSLRALRTEDRPSPSLARKLSPRGRGGNSCQEPSFRRLFTHRTWEQYTGQPTAMRWVQTLTTWGRSTIFRAVVPCVASAVGWATIFLVTPVGLTLQGTAIGLLLVFRTNNSYQRLAEARALWGKAIYLVRELMQGVSTVLDTRRGERLPPSAASVQLGRYCAAFGWVLKARLREGDEVADVLGAVLPAAEADWLASRRNVPVELIGCMRRTVYAEYERGRVPAHLEDDLRQLDLVVGGCERLLARPSPLAAFLSLNRGLSRARRASTRAPFAAFSFWSRTLSAPLGERLFASPIPPTMSRHVVRSLALWLLTLPVVLVGQLSPPLVLFYVAATSYIYVGIEELGVQVEQPFDILPMFQMAHVIASSAEDALVAQAE
ncbi:hypothetical protein EMIHUDRAFT_453109 [Emiliania huxleyi CCMP1516]|uniref:Uncharacterized protein n=2 Tax=Emiliania huxleyi TaxID=2903 RepID=A0A0D3IAV3_EMIH1|nr:hypothetical protein EMIHUDRAFT_453109 [Emiliania huxleyi CCMP1516]EOD08388.1 hypothetical protein EMIHUDRAFT_453109 [Emiliania huxleyi CCMP1516]|eukprot:XP_005760817.1 hypothetical protein EMIHUDRAFT_453109 [Emiliania huxleyi CCMP1516]